MQFVPANVEHEYITHLASAGKQFSQLREIAPLGLLAQAVPLFQSTRALRMILLRSHDTAVSDDVHGKNYISNRDIACIGVGGRGCRPGYKPVLPQLEKVDEFGC